MAQQDDDEEFNKLFSRRRLHLIKALAAMRIPEKSDIVLVCGEKEFYAHKWVLEASSEYFVTLFGSGMQESKSGRIAFTEVDAEALETVFDFLYLGEIDKMKTEMQMLNVLKIAHLMQLQDLFYCCCHILMRKISIDNFFVFFNHSKLYEVGELATELLIFWISHEETLLTTEHFLLLSFEQVRDFILFLQRCNECVDRVLFYFVNWVKHDFDDRAKLAVGMLEYIDFTFVTKQCVQILLKSQGLLTMPPNFVSKFKECGISLLISGCKNNVQNSSQDRALGLNGSAIIFFSKKSNVEMFCPSKNCNVVTRTKQRTCFQPLDLAAMAWLPICDIESKFCNFVSCEYKRRWYNAGFHVKMYDPKSEIYVECAKINDRRKAKICFFRGRMYLVGGHVYNEVEGCIEYDEEYEPKLCPTILYAEPDSKEWHNEISPPLLPERPRALASRYHLYILDGSDSAEMPIQFSSAPDKNDDWEIFYVSTEDTLTTEHFFIFENTLHALYLCQGKTIHLVYSHNDKKIMAQTYPEHPEGAKQVTRVCTCLVEQHIIIYVSTQNDTFRIPNFTWNPKTGKWNNLPKPSGKCEIPSAKFSMVALM